jgi:hypothetical protein
VVHLAAVATASLAQRVRPLHYDGAAFPLVHAARGDNRAMTLTWLDKIIEKYGIVDVLPLDVPEIVGSYSRIPPADLIISEVTSMERLIKSEVSGSRFLLTATDLTQHPFNLPPPVETRHTDTPLYLFTLGERRHFGRCA